MAVMLKHFILQVTIVLNGLPEVALSVLKTYNGIGGIVEIYQGWMLDKEEENITRYRYANVENVYLKWKGVIYSHSVDQENQKFGKVKITLECKNILGN